MLTSLMRIILININNLDKLSKVITDLKTNYEDYWKNLPTSVFESTPWKTSK